MKKVIITIGREYGSGGKYIGEQVAKKLGIPFYDKNILVEAQKKSKLDYSKFEENDENNKSDFLKQLELLNINNLNNYVASDIYQMVISNVIKEAAEKGSCVILGRNSNNLLKKDTINIFIYSNNLDFKLKRKMKIENITRDEALRRLNMIDKQRKNFYESVNKKDSWGSKTEYDYLIDSAVLGIENTINLIVDIYKKYVQE